MGKTNEEFVHNLSVDLDLLSLYRLKAEIEMGFNINKADIFSDYPILKALSMGYYRTAEYLIQCGADLSVQDSRGMTALTLIFNTGDFDLISNTMKSMGAVDMNFVEDNFNASFSMSFISFRNEPVGGNFSGLDVLLDAVDTNLEDITILGSHPLFAAIELNAAGLLDYVLSKGVSVFIRDKENRTPLQRLKELRTSYVGAAGDDTIGVELADTMMTMLKQSKLA